MIFSFLAALKYSETSRRDESDEEMSEDEKEEKIESDFYSLLSNLPKQKREKVEVIKVIKPIKNDPVEIPKEVVEPQKTSNEDNYIRNYQHTISFSHFEAISSTPPRVEIKKISWPVLGEITIELPKLSEPSEFDLTLRENQICEDSENPLTSFQREFLALHSSYKDLYFTQRTYDKEEEIRKVYCTHVLNHVLKAQKLVVGNNAKLAKNLTDGIVDDESLRDQGFVRPKVLILLSFRESAFRFVEMFHKMFVKKEKSKKNQSYQRFIEEFSGNDLNFPKLKKKPEDYEKMFSGNTDDNFKIGLSIKRDLLKFYTSFEKSDIIIASPIGLRMLFGGETNSDFLSSIELLILDQMEVLLMQNWDHLLFIFDQLHLQPQSRSDTDISRIRMSFINGWSKYYRQTILIASNDQPEFRSLVNKRCQNFRGKVQVRTDEKLLKGCIHQVILEVPQTFHRIEVKSRDQVFDRRFEYFTNTILPKFRTSTMAHCMIYVPSYFDFIRLRNYFKKENVSFTQLCEYTKPDKVSRARTLFYHGSTHFLLYTERAHFFNRFLIKGIRHVIFYQPPTNSHFYSEIINFMQDINQNPNDNIIKQRSVTMLYNNYDALSLYAIVGYEFAVKLLNSKKIVHKFVTNE